MAARDVFPVETHEADVCVVGAGMAGLCAAVAAARQGAQVVVIQDRPVLGGNASSEMRVHITGADRHNSIAYMRETGLLEEIRLDNLRRNRQQSFAVWDTILYEKTRHQPNLTLLLNCTCQKAEMQGDRIASVTGWQLTTQTYHVVRAAIFVDCSGDAVLAPLSGAEFRVGREARAEYGESIAPEEADRCTMGMTLCFGAREHDGPQPFEPPPWAYTFLTDDELPYRGKERWWKQGYWWIELGGEDDPIADTERLRDELLKIVYGVWDHIKNQGDHGADNWAMEWLQFLPSKRESRRYTGDHVLSQQDIEAEGRFDDLVAYGGWTMDDHHPAGFWAARQGHQATIFHPAPSPYGIPYRALYSCNIENLMFAGRAASCTHAAMSSTRVMGTGCSMGQAVGTAAALAVRLGADPRGLGAHVHQLQQLLLRDDCYLPWVHQELSPLTSAARLSASQGDPEPLRDGISRPVGGEMHSWPWRAGDHVEYLFNRPSPVRQATLIVDSALDKNIQLSHFGPYHQLTAPPEAMPKALHLDLLIEDEWRTARELSDNHQRLVRIAVDQPVAGVRAVLDQTWGAQTSNLYAFYVD